jgi:hypothetical protein
MVVEKASDRVHKVVGWWRPTTSSITARVILHVYPQVLSPATRLRKIECRHGVKENSGVAPMAGDLLSATSQPGRHVQGRTAVHMPYQ